MEREYAAEALDHVRCWGQPSHLKITDIKLAWVNLPPWGVYLVKVETNQGLCGFGEMRDGASPTYVKMLKSRLVGRNPCEVDRLLRGIRQFGGPGRLGAGYSAVEIALWDLAGKAYGVPVYQLMGGRNRDKVRLYGDIHAETGRYTGELVDAEALGRELRGYLEQGFTALKILSVDYILGAEGNSSVPQGFYGEKHRAVEEVRRLRDAGDLTGYLRQRQRAMSRYNVPGPLTGMHVTERGLDCLETYIRTVRDIIGDDIPLAVDHFGHYGLTDMIKIARRLEKYNLAWLEDMLPWYQTAQYRTLTQSTTAVIGTGEDIFLAEGFEPLLAEGGIAMAHPDLLTCGGILEGVRLSRLAEKYGVPVSVHMCESPVACMAAAHMATASYNFFAMEHDALDCPWWKDLVTMDRGALVESGYIRVEDAPGLGIRALNDEVIREHGLRQAGNVWMSTDGWEDDTALDCIWS